IPDTVPRENVGGRRADPGWGAASPIIAWQLYQHEGDLRVLETHYAGIRRWVELQRSMAKEHILEDGRYGDWVALELSSQAFVATAFYLMQMRILAEIAALLAHSDDAERYRAL